MPPDDASLAWLGELAAGDGPRYLQIVGFLELAIAQGRLRTGDRLTPQRRVAERLGVDLTTVTRAYDEARRRHLLVAQGARGTFVAAPKVAHVALVDLSMNIPPPPADIDLEALLKDGFSQLLLHADADLLMTYHLAGGSRVDRAAGARWLRPMLGDVADDAVVACPGAQSALAALILANTAPGDVILSEPVVYPGLRAAAMQLGRRVESVACDDEGMRPDALEHACREHGAMLVYLNPTIQNPTTVTMPERRRRDIVAAARRCDAQIVEDDPYWLLARDAPTPLAALAPERVHYVSTLSKCLSPGLRTAFVRSPDRGSQVAFLAALRSFSLMRAPLPAALVTQWLHDGTAERLMAGVKEEVAARQRIAARTLTTASSGRCMSREGVHLWYDLPSYWRSTSFAQAARGEGLAVTPSDAFATGATRSNAIRISLGAGRDRKRLDVALARLSALLARKPTVEEAIVI